MGLEPNGGDRLTCVSAEADNVKQVRVGMRAFAPPSSASDVDRFS